MNERFTLQLSLAANLPELAAWLENATVGERAVYASGYVLPREHESVKQVAIWADAGLVHPVQQRDPDDPRRFQWLIEKSSDRPQRASCNSRSSPRGGPRGSRVKPDLTREQMRCLHRLLAKAATRGDPCPSLAQMARHVMALSPRARVDRSKRNRVHYLLGRLETEGAIQRTRGDAQTRPVVTILTGRGRGKSTRAGCDAAAQGDHARTRRKDR